MSENKRIVQREILEKINSQSTYIPGAETIFRVKTDVNIFPYNRFFRGDRFSSTPRIWDREAGWSPLIETIEEDYRANMSLLGDAGACFQIPCSTILPCTTNQYQPSTLSKVYISP